MVFSDEDKAVIKHYYQRGYTAYKIWKENPEKNWDKASVKRLINRFVEKGTMERKEGSGRKRTARTPANEEAVEEQQQQPAAKSLRQISTIKIVKSVFNQLCIM